MQLAALVPALSEITKLERTIKAKQLCFDFANEPNCEPNNDDSSREDSVKGPAAKKHATSDEKRIRVLKKISIADHQGSEPAALATAAQAPVETPTVNLESVRRGQRYGAPVRMGAAMVAVLKRYGITDQEIQAGVEAYARKFQTAAAS